MKKVFRKTDEEFIDEEYLGEYLHILPIIYQNAGEIKTDAMVYFLHDDGSIGVINRMDAKIKDSNNQYYPTKLTDEDDIINNIAFEENEDSEA